MIKRKNSAHPLLHIYMYTYVETWTNSEAARRDTETEKSGKTKRGAEKRGSETAQG